MNLKITALMITVLVVLGSIGLYLMLTLMPFLVRIIIASASIIIFYKVVKVTLEEKQATEKNGNDNNGNSATDN